MSDLYYGSARTPQRDVGSRSYKKAALKIALSSLDLGNAGSHVLVRGTKKLSWSGRREGSFGSSQGGLGYGDVFPMMLITIASTRFQSGNWPHKWLCRSMHAANLNTATSKLASFGSSQIRS